MKNHIDLLGHDVPVDAAASVLIGLSAHIVLNRFELWPKQLFAVYWASVAIYTRHLVAEQGQSLASAIVRTLGLSYIVIATLLVSVTAHRLLFHRLRRFPGPLSCKLTKWTTVSTDLNGLRSRFVDQQHKKYGDIVRTGPRELSINDPSVISAIGGGNSPCQKGPWYVGIHGGKGGRSHSLHSTVNKEDHAARRRIWDAGFSQKALKSYESEIHTKTQQLIEELSSRARKGEVLNIDDWCLFFGYDLMGAVGFGTSFDMLSKGVIDKNVEILETSMAHIMVVSNLPYLSELVRYLPNPMKDFEVWLNMVLKKRIESGTKEDYPDVFAFLLDEDKQSGWKHTWEELVSDAMLMALAGAETSSTVLGLCLFTLSQHPDVLQKLRDELDDVFGKGVPCDDFDDLNKKCPYLNAVINETMRMYPPIASGLQKETPASGLQVQVQGKQIVIPPHTVVHTPTMTMHRDPRYFSPEPNAYRPERWLDHHKNEERFEIKAFNPFSFGPTGCIGKTLAYMEIRLALANLVQTFNVKPTKEFNAKEFEDGLLDIFTTKRSKKMPVTLELRQQR